jgi:hypothetical protein
MKSYISDNYIIFCSVRETSKSNDNFDIILRFVMTATELSTDEINQETTANHRECPQCHCVIERTKGCNYVICPQCQLPFCFACGTEMPKGVNSCPAHTCDGEAFKKAQIVRRVQQKERIGKSTLRNEIRISVQPPVGDCFAIQIGPSENIGTLKTKIHAKSGMAPTDQQPRFAGKPLSDDSRSVGSYGIRDNSTIVLIRETQGGHLTTF